MFDRLSPLSGTGPHPVNSARRCSGHAGCMTGTLLPRPAARPGYAVGGRAGERAGAVTPATLEQKA
jgi:hypothetical protein